MGTQWIDEEPYPGPAERTALEEWQALANAFSSVSSGVVAASYGTHFHSIMPRGAGKTAVARIEEAMRKAAERMEEAAQKVEDREWSLVPPDYRTPPPPRHYGPPPKKRFSRRNRRTF